MRAKRGRKRGRNRSGVSRNKKGRRTKEIGSHSGHAGREHRLATTTRKTNSQKLFDGEAETQERE